MGNLHELILRINEESDMRVELTYYSDSSSEGYKANFCAYPESITEGIYDDPLDAVKSLEASVVICSKCGSYICKNEALIEKNGEVYCEDCK